LYNFKKKFIRQKKKNLLTPLTQNSGSATAKRWCLGKDCDMC